MIYYQKKRCTISAKHLINILLIISSISLISCDEITNNSEKKYMEISTKRYTSTETAITELYAYLGKYSKRSAHCEDVNNIITEFNEMSDFFGEDCGFSEFLRKSEEVSFPNSSYKTISSTWNYLYEERKLEYICAMLNNITKSTFSKDLSRYACDECEKQWGDGLLGLTITDCEENEIGEITNLEGNVYGKKCSGTYTIHMEGPFGLKDKFIRIHVEGSISITTSGTYRFDKINSNFEKIID